MIQTAYPNILTRVASVEQSYFPPRRPCSIFLRAQSANTAQDLKRDIRPRRPSGLKRATSVTPTATLTVSTDTIPQSEDNFLDATVHSPSLNAPDEPTLTVDKPISTDDQLSDDNDEPEITTLDLSGSGFDCIPTTLFMECDSFLYIKTLDLSENPLCSSQDLYMTDTIILPHLTKLLLRRCGMSRVDPLVKYLKAPELEELDISSHEFTGFVPEFQQIFPKLTSLIASRGQFEFVEEAAMRGLGFLDLTENLVKDEDGKLKEMGAGLGVEVML